MRILITGGSGMVGSHCAQYYALKNNKNKIIILDDLRRSYLFDYHKKSVEYNWRYLAKYKNIELIKGDVCSQPDVKRAIGGGVDLVIHAAAQPGVGLSVCIPDEDFRINAWGTLNVLETLRKRSKDATFVYCSTNKVYGGNIDMLSLVEFKKRFAYKNRSGISETMSVDLTGHTPYGVSKLVGDLYTQEYSHIYKMRTAVFRMSCIYGIRQFGFEDQGWVAWFTIATLLNKPITIYGNGKQVRDILYVEDLVCAFDKFVNSKLSSGLFNIGGGKNNTMSLLEFLDMLKGLTGKVPRIKFKTWRPSDQKVYISDISKIKKALNWQPKVSVREGILKLIDWVKANEDYFS